LIFSKAAVGRFPVDGEVEGLFAALRPAGGKPPGNAAPGEPPDEEDDGGRSGMLRRLADKFRN
jgi:hypothetical protein